MGGVAAKPAALRARKNKKSTAATLMADHDLKVPPLPMDRIWHPNTIDEWQAIWESPMAPEFAEDAGVTYHGLLKLAILIDDFWNAESSNQRKDLMVEIRLQRTAFGLTPRDRAGLHWELDRGQQAADRKAKREHRTEPQAPGGDTADPRAALGKQGFQVLQGGAAS